MKLKQTDKEKISKHKCQTKHCLNKAAAIFNKKFLCERCYSRVHPTAIDRRFYYVNYIRNPR